MAATEKLKLVKIKKKCNDKVALLEKWKTNFPWLIVKELEEPTATCKVSSSALRTFRLGCLCCSMAGSRGLFGRGTVESIKMSVLKKHAEWDVHKTNWQNYLLKQRLLSDDRAPSADAFDAIVKRLLEGAALGDGLKEWQMAFCIAEAIKVHHQRLLDKAEAISWMRDESRGKCDLRFKCCNRILQVNFGYAGREVDPHGTGRGVHEATEKILRRLCTRCLGAPAVGGAGPYSMAVGKFDEQRFESYRSKTRSLAVDAAANEQLASEMHRDKELAGDLQALFPQLAGVELDAAHASRRFLRPWNVLAETSVVVNELVRAKDSFPQMLHHSRPFRNVYEKHLQQATGGLGSRSSAHLAAAKHRFESIARPLGRLCLHLPSVLGAALEIATSTTRACVRKNLVGWLKRLTTSRLVLLSMCADASDEVLQMTRQVEAEATCAGAAHAAAARTLERLAVLFEQGQAINENHPGFTSLMLRRLSQVTAIPLPGSSADIVVFGIDGGVPGAQVNEALAVMRRWLRVLVEVVEAEFPGYQLSAAMQVFLVGSATDTAHLGEASVRQLKRIAQVFGLDELSLVSEYARLAPIARSVVEQQRVGAYEAWSRVFCEIDADARRSSTHPCETVRQALVLAMSKASSTSGLESGFSKSRLRWSPQRAHCKEHTEEWHHFIINDLASVVGSADAKVKLLDDARKCWCMLYGTPRTHAKRRLDFMVARPHRVGAQSAEKVFIKRRREATSSAVDSAVSGGFARSQARPDASDFASEVKLAKEVEFWQKKQSRVKVQAHLDNALLADEVEAAPGIEEAGERTVAERRKRQRARERAEQRNSSKLGAKIEEFKALLVGKRAWLCEAGAGEVLSKAGGIVVADMLSAEVVVAPADVIHSKKLSGLAALNPLLPWVVALKGCFVCGPGCTSGVKYMPALRLRRTLCVSVGNAASDLPFWSAIRKMTRGFGGSKWTVGRGDLATFQNCLRTKNAGEIVLAVVSEDELALWQAAVPAHCRKRVVTSGLLFSASLSIDFANSCTF